MEHLLTNFLQNLCCDFTEDFYDAQLRRLDILEQLHKNGEPQPANVSFCRHFTQDHYGLASDNLKKLDDSWDFKDISEEQAAQNGIYRRVHKAKGFEVPYPHLDPELVEESKAPKAARTPVKRKAGDKQPEGQPTPKRPASVAVDDKTGVKVPRHIGGLLSATAPPEDPASPASKQPSPSPDDDQPDLTPAEVPKLNPFYEPPDAASQSEEEEHLPPVPNGASEPDAYNVRLINKRARTGDVPNNRIMMPPPIEFEDHEIGFRDSTNDKGRGATKAKRGKFLDQPNSNFMFFDRTLWGYDATQYGDGDLDDKEKQAQIQKHKLHPTYGMFLQTSVNEAEPPRKFEPGRSPKVFVTPKGRVLHASRSIQPLKAQEAFTKSQFLEQWNSYIQKENITQEELHSEEAEQLLQAQIKNRLALEQQDEAEREQQDEELTARNIQKILDAGAAVAVREARKSREAREVQEAQEAQMSSPALSRPSPVSRPYDAVRDVFTGASSNLPAAVASASEQPDTSSLDLLATVAIQGPPPMPMSMPVPMPMQAQMPGFVHPQQEVRHPQEIMQQEDPVMQYDDEPTMQYDDVPTMQYVDEPPMQPEGPSLPQEQPIMRMIHQPPPPPQAPLPQREPMRMQSQPQLAMPEHFRGQDQVYEQQAPPPPYHDHRGPPPSALAPPENFQNLPPGPPREQMESYQQVQPDNYQYQGLPPQQASVPFAPPEALEWREPPPQQTEMSSRGPGETAEYRQRPPEAELHSRAPPPPPFYPDNRGPQSPLAPPGSFQYQALGPPPEQANGSYYSQAPPQPSGGQYDQSPSSERYEAPSDPRPDQPSGSSDSLVDPQLLGEQQQQTPPNGVLQQPQANFFQTALNTPPPQAQQSQYPSPPSQAEQYSGPLFMAERRPRPSTDTSPGRTPFSNPGGVDIQPLPALRPPQKRGSGQLVAPAPPANQGPHGPQYPIMDTNEQGSYYPPPPPHHQQYPEHSYPQHGYGHEHPHTMMDQGPYQGQHAPQPVMLALQPSAPQYGLQQPYPQPSPMGQYPAQQRYESPGPYSVPMMQSPPPPPHSHPGNSGMSPTHGRRNGSISSGSRNVNKTYREIKPAPRIATSWENDGSELRTVPYNPQDGIKDYSATVPPPSNGPTQIRGWTHNTPASRKRPRDPFVHVAQSSSGTQDGSK